MVLEWLDPQPVHSICARGASCCSRRIPKTMRCGCRTVWETGQQVYLLEVCSLIGPFQTLGDKLWTMCGQSLQFAMPVAQVMWVTENSGEDVAQLARHALATAKAVARPAPWMRKVFAACAVAGQSAQEAVIQHCCSTRGLNLLSQTWTHLSCWRGRWNWASNGPSVTMAQSVVLKPSFNLSACQRCYTYIVIVGEASMSLVSAVVSRIQPPL